MSCYTCNIEYDDDTSHRDHIKSEIHTLNLKRKSRKQKPMSLDEFSALKDTVEQQISEKKECTSNKRKKRREKRKKQKFEEEKEQEFQISDYPPYPSSLYNIFDLNMKFEVSHIFISILYFVMNLIIIFKM